MNMSRATVCSGVVAIMVILASVGCGSGGSTPPPVGAVAASTHPLVAQYSVSHFDSGLSAWVEFGTDTNYGRQTSVATGSSGSLAIQKLNILVAGMLPQTTYHMRAHASWAGGSWVDQDRTFTTGALPGTSTAPQFATFSVSTPTAGLTPAPGVELMSLVTQTGTGVVQDVVTDTKGRVIWYCPLNGVPLKPMPNGHFMVNTGTDVLEVDLTCNTIRDVSTAQMDQALQASGHSFPPLNLFHHDMLVLPNGHWILLGQVTTDFTDLQGYPGTTAVLGDVLLDVDPSGNVAWAWSAFEQINAQPPAIPLDINRHLFQVTDWTHSNAIVYTADGNLLLSMRAQSWVLKIDYANGTGTGNILWRLGQDGDFQLANGDSSQWFYGQHYPSVLSVNGSTTTLAVFDDGDYRIVPNNAQCSSGTSVPPCYTRATIYQIDESNNQATLQWQYLPGFYTFWGGSIGVLSNGDVEFDSSEPNLAVVGSPVIEVTQTDTPQIVWQMSITGAYAYRAYRIPSLYPGVTWQQ
jgi:arylsulfate sulfotransferase